MALRTRPTPPAIAALSAQRAPHTWARRFVRLASLTLGLVACAPPGTPRIDGGPGAPANPAEQWPVPAAAKTPPPPAVPPTAPSATLALSADSATAGSVQLSMPDVVDLALRNNPTTRQSWALAQSAADVYGASRGALFPTVNGNVDLERSGGSGGSNGTFTTTTGSTGTTTGGDTTGAHTGTGTTNGAGGSNGSTTRTELTPSLSLSYLVFDFGGRAGSIEGAKQRAIAADLSHNATVNDVVLQAESTLFSYLATRSLRDAQITAVQEATADTAASEARLRVGVGTLQDVLQTTTALAQARFQLETLQGNLLSARGALAAAMGLPANARFDVPAVPASDSVTTIAASVDTLINRAITMRPELAGARANAAALAADIRVARAAGYPALTLSSTGSYARPLGSSSTSTAGGRSYSLLLGLQIPIFDGFSRQYDVRSAEAQYEAGLAQVASTEQQITVQVFTSYATLQTAADGVTSAVQLLASAQQSANVATATYREGVGTIVDVLLARSALDQARAEEIQARWQWQTALAQLAHDVGSLDLSGRPNVPLRIP